MVSGGGRKKIKYQKSNIKIVESAFGGGCFYGSSLWGRVDVGFWSRFAGFLQIFLKTGVDKGGRFSIRDMSGVSSGISH